MRVSRTAIGFDFVIYLMVIVSLLMLLAFYNKRLLVIGIPLLVILCLYARERSRQQKIVLEHHLDAMTLRIAQNIKVMVDELPQGVIAFTAEGLVLWRNERVKGWNPSVESGRHISEAWPEFPFEAVWKAEDATNIEIVERTLSVQFRQIKSPENIEVGVAFLTDITDVVVARQRCEALSPAVAIIQIDNYDEILQGIDEAKQQALLGEVTRLISDWIVDMGGLGKKFSDDKFIAIFSQAVLIRLEKERFAILERVRSMAMGNRIPVTLSIGVTEGWSTYQELGEYAQAGLDLALGRGGDQAVVNRHGKLEFYGGKTGAVEKSARVRARIIAQALHDLMQGASRILVMGHKGADFDSLGSAIGVLKMARVAQKSAKIVSSQPGAAAMRLHELLQEQSDYADSFIAPEATEEWIDDDTLVVVVDTHNAALVEVPKVIEQTERIVIVDHHRRSEGMICKNLLLYLEPSASSTAELVTELLQYFDAHGKLDLSRIEATALYAGIVVDTKNFAVQTGARTFEATAYLRRSGADPTLVRHLFREDYDTFVQRSKIIQNTEMVEDGIAVGIAPEPLKNAQIIAAKTADTLLSIEGVKVSFVICQHPEGVVAVSARSSGELNVQMVMEKLGGGGHQTVAGAQIKGQTVSEVREQIVAVINSFKEERDLT